MTAQSATVMQQTKQSDVVRQSRDEIAGQYAQVIDAIARRAFEIFERRGGLPGYELEDWIRAEAELLHPAPVSVTESEAEYIVCAEVPGFSHRDIEIFLEPRALAISGERETRHAKEDGRMILSEWGADRIFRILALLTEVDTSRVSSSLKDGILTVDLPKARISK
jgi:HSP20 family protein